jgi:16S rRNA G966 N2-methylase RsmD
VSKQAIQVIRENLLKVGFEKQAKIMRSDVIRFFKHWHGSYAFDLVFVDPPYGKAWVCRTLELLQQWQFIAPCARVVCEIEYRVELPESFGQLHICWYKRYGNTVVCVYSAFAK